MSELCAQSRQSKEGELQTAEKKNVYVCLFKVRKNEYLKTAVRITKRKNMNPEI